MLLLLIRTTVNWVSLLICQSLRKNSNSVQLQNFISFTRKIIFLKLRKMDTLCTNKVAAAMPKIKIYHYHLNHIFSKMILKCESCIESWILPTFFDWLLFIPASRPFTSIARIENKTRYMQSYSIKLVAICNWSLTSRLTISSKSASVFLIIFLFTSY